MIEDIPGKWRTRHQGSQVVGNRPYEGSTGVKKIKVMLGVHAMANAAG